MIGLPVAIALQLLVIYAPPLQDLFHTVPLSASQWGIVIGVSASIWVLEEIRKAVFPHLFDKGK